MEQLGLYPQYPGETISPTNTTLHQFENALASMTALMYWAGVHKYAKCHHLNMLI
jgi:hypothetical protein